MTTTCPACGQADIAATTRFCPGCGAALATPPPEQAHESGPASSTTIHVQQDVGTVAGGKATGVELGGVSGDVTVNQQGDTFRVQLGNVGAGSQVAVGKQIQQTGGGGGALTASDRTALTAALDRVAEVLPGSNLPAARVAVAQEFLRQLADALLVTEGAPDAATIRVCGDWLLDNAPAARPALVRALTSPAGGKALAAAGEAAQAWARARLS